MNNPLEQVWYQGSSLAYLLLPVSWLFSALVLFRRWLYSNGFLKIHRLEVPVIIVGNITVGGSGKTPLVLYITESLRKAGYRPGIVSRGYKARGLDWPQEVNADADPLMVGDETVLLAMHSGCPVVADPDRVSAARVLLERHQCDVIVADDGLQHYALARDIEIVVIDGVRRFGNGYSLPAGPLRESQDRIKQVDFVITNGNAKSDNGTNEYQMSLTGETLYNLQDESKTCRLGDLSGKTIHAVAGIGHPQRFFDDLKRAGLLVIEHGFPDHHDFRETDVYYGADCMVIMTEKDAVKCRRFANSCHWYLPVSATVDRGFEASLLRLLNEHSQRSRLAEASC